MNFFKKYYAELTGLLVFLVYLLTVCPAVVEFDCGELAAVQATLGIAHPPGYPLFTIVGFLFSKIPLPITTIHQLNILCSIWCALSVIFFIKIVRLLIDNAGHLVNKNLSFLGKRFYSYINSPSNESSFDFVKYLVPIFSGLLFSFSLIIWSQSTSVEVYSLQIFLYSLVLYFFFKAYLKTRDNESLFKNENKIWLAVGLLLGLSFSNHMMTMYLLPALIYLYFEKFRFNKNSVLRFLVLSVEAFVIASLFYSYLLIRSSQNPVMNFGGPSNLQGLINHVTAKYYNKFFFDGSTVIKRQIWFFIKSMGFYDGKFLAGDFNILLVITLLGIIGTWFSFRRLFISLSLIILTCLILTVNYNIPDIYQYFSAAYYSLFLFSALGVLYLLKIMKHPKYDYLTPVIILIVLVFIRIGANYKQVDKSNYYVIQDYAKALLKIADKNSVIFTKNWGYTVSPDFYLQNVEHYRPDVIVIHKDLLSYDWYLQKVKEKYKLPLDPKTQMIDAATLLKNRPYYLTPEMVRDELPKGKFKIGKNENIVPDQLLFKVVKVQYYVPAGNSDFEIRFPYDRSVLVNYIGDLVGSMLVNRIRYELHYQKYDRAKVYLNKLVTDLPFYKLPEDIKEAFGI